ncbi:WD40-repeat-containing domain protein [Cantharellus anzutake]|uniref:WD40-repeat-containing domain protein n=1 Tax=Cantharellus anzutake TaxID=1750568 RepID=UPI001907042E|nr:WD40-repeat-containing domain protein [Cantharellus anzutake]KAF8318621.1 WD40-repeat-containing domain protein [Cantharellus anzutake]
MMLVDEGYNEDEIQVFSVESPSGSLSCSRTRDYLTGRIDVNLLSPSERTALLADLLGTLSIGELSSLHCKVLSLLQVDIIGELPPELALQVLSWLPVESLLTASFVNKQWNLLCKDQSLWRLLCEVRGWKWKSPGRFVSLWREESNHVSGSHIDEGFGDDEAERIPRDLYGVFPLQSKGPLSRNSAPALLPSPISHQSPDYRTLFKTRTILRQRLRRGEFSRTTIQAHSRNFPRPGGSHQPVQGHTSTIYALCLSNDPVTGESTLFTASRDRSIIQWDVATPASLQTRPIRVFKNAHVGSVLSVCAAPEFGYLISGGSDGRVIVWSISTAAPFRVFEGQNAHLDSVLCVRCDKRIIVSCSKDRTIRTYELRTLEPSHILASHRAAVNSVAISDKYIVSASGDRSLRLWDSETGELLRVFEGHHARGLAAVDFDLPYILTGSSDRQIRLYDLSTQKGWSTDPWRHTHRPTHRHHSHLVLEGPGVSHTSSEPGNGSNQTTATFVGLDIHHAFAGFGLGAAHTHTSQAQAFPGGENNGYSGGINGHQLRSSIYSQRAVAAYNSLIERFSGPMRSSLGSSAHNELDACPTCSGTGRVPLEVVRNVHHGQSFLHQVHQHHQDLVRAVAMDADVVVSASYDATIKVWDRRTGVLLADLVGGHRGRIFGVAFDCTKVTYLIPYLSAGNCERKLRDRFASNPFLNFYLGWYPICPFLKTWDAFNP